MAIVESEPIDAANEAALIAALFTSNNAIEWVSRTLLVSAIGTELANRFLPELPEFVAINTDDFETAVRAYRPELIPITSS